MEEGVRDRGDGGGCQESLNFCLSPCVDRGIWHTGLTGHSLPFTFCDMQDIAV